MATLQDLLQRREALDREIEATKKRERADAIAQVRTLMSEHGLTLADLGARATADSPRAGKAAKPNGAKVAPKYRNAASGDTWSGRGLQPNWLKAALAGGAKLDDFKI